jgi:hypothetical protein
MSVAVVGWFAVGAIQFLLEIVAALFVGSASFHRWTPFEAGEQAEQAKVQVQGESLRQVVGAGIGLPLSLPSQSEANFWLHCCSEQTAMPAQTN